MFLTWNPGLRAGNHSAEGANRVFPTYSPKVALEPKGTGRASGDATPRSPFGLAHLRALGPPQLANRSLPRAAGRAPLPTSAAAPRPTSPPAPPTLADSARRARTRRLPEPSLCEPARGTQLSTASLPAPFPKRGFWPWALGPRTAVALELHFQRRRWVRSPSEASYGSREPGRTDWAARVMPRDPRGWMPRPPAPSSCSLSLFLSLSRLLGPQLASAGTFRALKEPLAFLRALELVSSGLCAGRNQQVRRGRMGCSRFCSKPGRPAASFNPLSSGAIPGWRGQDGGIRLGGGSVDEFLQALRRGVISQARRG